MDHIQIIDELNSNQKVFSELLLNKEKKEYLWKPEPNSWCLLEVVCHLIEEEREDFRARVKHTLETPDDIMAMFDQIAWVTERKYIEQDYPEMVEKLLIERTKSIKWIKSLKNPCWENAYQHPKLGPLSAEHFLASWLAHDLFHFRQIIRIRYRYLQQTTKNDLSYAGLLK